MEEECNSTLLGMVAGLAQCRDVWKDNPLGLDMGEVKNAEKTDDPPLYYFKKWKSAAGVSGTRKLLVETLVDAKLADLASQVCKKIASMNKSKRGEFFIFL